jgi:hypothetical protein
MGGEADVIRHYFMAALRNMAANPLLFPITIGSLSIWQIAAVITGVQAFTAFAGVAMLLAVEQSPGKDWAIL